MSGNINEITGAIIGAAIEVHRQIGPGLLESAYLECLSRELVLRGTPFEREKPLPAGTVIEPPKVRQSATRSTPALAQPERDLLKEIDQLREQIKRLEKDLKDRK